MPLRRRPAVAVAALRDPTNGFSRSYLIEQARRRERGEPAISTSAFTAWAFEPELGAETSAIAAATASAAARLARTPGESLKEVARRPENALGVGYETWVAARRAEGRPSDLLAWARLVQSSPEVRRAFGYDRRTSPLAVGE